MESIFSAASVCLQNRSGEAGRVLKNGALEITMPKAATGKEVPTHRTST
jgi:hypothetical protein